MTGDYSANGTVDAADYTVWKDNFGTTRGLVFAIAVPEIPCLALVAIGATCCSLLRQVTRRRGNT
ncbi:MAG: hypothetical protein KDA99_16590 [Planctomycetales bacterium]|nr:hypothetical protein [Planctomycetales bacterium]